MHAAGGQLREPPPSKLGRGGGGGHAHRWGEVGPGSGKSQCKGPGGVGSVLSFPGRLEPRAQEGLLGNAIQWGLSTAVRTLYSVLAPWGRAAREGSDPPRTWRHDLAAG